MPTDVTNPYITNPNVFSPYAFPGILALSGIQTVSDFPKLDDAKGPTEWILVRYEPASQYTRPSPYAVDFKGGRILVTVKKPSHFALVKTPMGDIAVGANGDVLLSYTGGILRVENLDGVGENIKVNLNQGPFAGKGTKLTIAPGYEVVAGDRKLTQADMRPHDGIARRNFKVLQNGEMAVSEFSLESVLRNVSIVVEMEQQMTGVKERRIVGDMSKMAAVLNYMNGTQGYTEEK